MSKEHQFFDLTQYNELLGLQKSNPAISINLNHKSIILCTLVLDELNPHFMFESMYYFLKFLDLPDYYKVISPSLNNYEDFYNDLLIWLKRSQVYIGSSLAQPKDYLRLTDPETYCRNCNTDVRLSLSSKDPKVFINTVCRDCNETIYEYTNSSQMLIPKKGESE